MPGRTLLLVAILVVAVSAPFLLSKPKPTHATPAPFGPSDRVAAKPTETSTFMAVWQRISGGSTKADPTSPFAATEPTFEQARTLLAENQQLLAGEPMHLKELSGAPGVTLADALRFDVTPAWVASVWPRVTPQRTESGWYGLRVPLVTGTTPEDVVGSLTYYFNSENYVERLTLYGYTGDAEVLISFVQQQYGLRPYAAIGRGLFLSFYGTEAIGVLEVEDAPVQTLGQSGNRYRVQLELNLPREGAKLSSELMDKLRRLHEAKLL